MPRYNKKISRKLRAQILSAALIKKGFVSGDEETCNYELYLTDFINSCPNFMKSFHAPFIYQKDQAHGEPDVISGDYGLDYKLIASQTALQARAVFSHQIWKMSDGVTAYGAAKNQVGTINVTRLFSALRDYDLEGLIKIRNEKTDDHVLVDVKKFLGLLETKKNLLLFFPYEFWMDETCDEEEGIGETLNAIEVDFTNSMKYRENFAPEYDTYFATIYDQRFLLMKYEYHFQLLDNICTSTSPTFTKLDDYGM